MLLETKKLNKTYHTGQVDFRALKDVSVSFARQEFTSLAGPSGSGKTTLLNCVGCIDRADSGEILLEGINTVGRPDTELAALRRENYGFIFQTYNLIPVLSVFENIELPLKLLKKFDDGEIAEKVKAILEEVGLGGMENRYPLELSGGQQQRVSIARALVKKPKIVLADEPTANLDSKTGADIIDLMRKLNEVEGITFIFSTHDPMVIERAGRRLVIRDGEIVEDSRS